MDISVATNVTDSVEADAVVVHAFEDGLPEDALAGNIDRGMDGELSRAISDGRVSTAAQHVTPLLTFGRLPFGQLLVVGAGRREEWSPERARTTAGAAVRYLRALKQRQVSLLVPALGDLAANVAASVHGAEIANFSTAQYKTKEPGEQDVERLQVLVSSGNPEEITAAADKAHVIGEATNVARLLANEPGNKLTPTIFAAEAQQVAGANGLEIDVMDEARMRDNGYGSILGVSRGSQEPAKMVTLRYRGDPEAPTIGFVGKGITFDSGGISIKPAENMHLMKSDMSGAAAVLGAMQAIAQLGPRTNVVGVLCISENLPSGSALKPGDVLTAGNGMTIEVLNTDAEGRLVMADGLVHARSQGATHLVDVATLTGACVVALGRVATGVFGSSQPWTELLLEAAAHTGERMWQMPLFPEYREQLNSDVADVANVGGRDAGAITAAAFLREFAGDAPWVHLDIAGTSWVSSDKPHLGKGPSGVATATLAQLAELVDDRGLPA